MPSRFVPSLDLYYTEQAYLDAARTIQPGDPLLTEKLRGALLYSLGRAFSPLGDQPQVNAAVRRVLSRAGSFPVGILGVGTEGVVYRLENGRALKLTNGLAEVAAATRLEKRPHPNIIAFHDAFLMAGLRGQAIGVVVRDVADVTFPHIMDRKNGYDELTRYVVKEVGELCFYCQEVSKPKRGRFPGWESPQVRLHMKDRMARWIECFENTAPTYFAGDDEAGRLGRSFLVGILSAVKHLYANGIYTVDTHPGNIGLKNEVPVLFDVGYSSVAGEPQVVDVAAVIENPPALDVIEV